MQQQLFLTRWILIVARIQGKSFIHQGKEALLRNEERVKSVSLEENRDSEFKEIYVMDKEKSS